MKLNCLKMLKLVPVRLARLLAIGLLLAVDVAAAAAAARETELAVVAVPKKL